MHARTLLLVGALLTVASLPEARAQFTGTPTVFNPAEQVAGGTAYRTFYRPGEDLIRVQILGDIGSGIYVIGAGTTLIELLSLAGGTPLGDRGAEIDQEVTVRVLREANGVRSVIYEADAERLLTRPDQYPALQNGDLVTIQTRLRRRYNLRETLQIVSSLASIALLAIRLSETF